MGDSPESVAAPESASERAVARIHRRGDRWMAAFVVAHALLALALAPVHGTWPVTLAVIAAAGGAFGLAARRRPGHLATRMIAGVALQAFTALHIHQMAGLAEMHFFYFTATTAMIIYQDWRAPWPGLLAIVAQHAGFALLHNAGVHPGGQPFFVQDRVGALQIGFHFGIALAQAAVASFWAETLRRRTERGLAARGHAEAQAEALRAQVTATRASEARFRALTAASPVAVFHSDLDGGITYVSERGPQLWGAAEADMLGHGWMQQVHPDDRDALLAAWQAALADGRDYEHEFRVVRGDGELRHVRGRAAVLHDAAGIAVGSVGTVEDVTGQHEASAALVESERRFRTVVESIDQGLLVTDVDDRIIYANGRVTEITGYAVEELVGRVGAELLVPEESRAAFAQGMAERLEGRAARYELELVRKDGSRVATENGAVPFRDASGEVVGTVGVVADISARKALEAELRRQAFEDSLTGLANRARLRAQVERALEREDPARQPAVLLIDLDDFKHVNDSLGHEAGDRLLALVADRLLHATRGSDTVARLGGDEFAILLGAVQGSAEAVIVAERVVAALTAPFTLQGHEVRVGASVGVAVACGGETPDDLLRNADLALYRAKDAGKGGHATFAPEMHAAALARLELEAELRRAIGAHELVLHYQPIVELASGLVTGVEALVRWQHPERGMIPPSAFVPLAEATGLVVPLGRWVLEEACRTAAGWGAAGAGVEPLAISVNVSGRQLLHADFADHVTGALRASGLDAERLVLEVTESVLLADLDAAIARLDALRAVGVRVALDDFGTGYSSLAYLQRLPVDVLKIDRAFTADVTAAGRSAAFARAVLSFATALGAHTVAEGVETEAQHAELLALGCGYGQGWLYARPLDAAGVAELVRSRRARVPAPRPSGAFTSALAIAAGLADSCRGGAPPTVLVVDDEAAVRRLVRRMLEQHAYAVLEARGGAEALRILDAHPGAVDVVLADVVMPGTSGWALAEAVSGARRAGRRMPSVLLMSGFGDGATTVHEAGDVVGPVLEKPFTAELLIDAVGSVLRTRSAA